MATPSRLKRLCALALLSLSVTSWNHVCFSETSRDLERPSVEVFGGVATASQDIGTAFTLGAKLSVPWRDPLSFGGYLSYLNKSLLGTSTKVWVVAPEATFHLDYYLPGFGVGAKAGLQFVDTDPNSGTEGTYFVIGPHVTYDYPVSDAFTVGAEANGIFPFTDTAVTLADFLGVIKYSF